MTTRTMPLPGSADRVRTILTLCLLLGAAAEAAYGADTTSNRVRWSETPRPVAAFELTDDGGHVFTDKQLRGRTSLVFFGFTHCRNVCPPTLQNLRRVSRSLAEQKLPVSVVMISVDGDRDTPPVMKSYLQPYMPGFIGVTGKPDDVSRLAAGFSAVFFRGMPTDTQGGYDVEHTSQVYLVDAKGRLRVTFYNAPTGEIEEAARLVQKE